MRVVALAVLIGCIATLSEGAEIPVGEICSRAGPPFVGPCYTVRARKPTQGVFPSCHPCWDGAQSGSRSGVRGEEGSNG